MPFGRLKVLDFTHLLPGEVCSTLLADLGAQILRIEKPGENFNENLPPMVEGESLYYWSLHRDKKRIKLDLKSPQAKAVILKLVKDADIVLDNFRPRVMTQLGFGYETLSAINKGIIYCNISGYGEDSSWANKPGHDLTFVAESGILDATKDNAGTPVMPGTFISDYMSGNYGCLAITAALWEREKTGKGKKLSISMFESALSTLAVLATQEMWCRQAPETPKTKYPDAIAGHSLYRCQDGRYLAAAPVEPQFWREFLTLINRSDLLSYHPVTDSDFLLAEIQNTIANKDLKEWLSIFSGHHCCVSPVNNLDEAISYLPEGHEKLIVNMEHPSLGMVPQLTTPIRSNFHPNPLTAKASASAEQDTEELLRSLQLEEKEIQEIMATSFKREKL
jgi:crotonobetainyl-CoA:carnitine CoA-transferase CaiB-like acyl-CoA transferase